MRALHRWSIARWCSATAAVLCLTITSVEAQRYYGGVWRGGSDGYAMWVGQSWDSFVDKWEKLSGQNRRLVDLEVYSSNGKRRFAGVWRAGNDGHYLYAGKSWHDFLVKWEELGPKGLRLIDIETYTVDGKRRWAGVWRAGSGGHYLWVGQKWSAFERKWKELKGKGLRLIDIEVYHTKKGWRYAGVWGPGKDKHYLYVNKSWKEFKAKWDELKKKDLRLVDLETYTVDGKRRYTGVWREGEDKYALWTGVDYENFRTKWYDLAQEGYRLIDIESYGVSCSSTCLNNISGGRGYNRKIEVTNLHCSKKPDNCGKPKRAGAATTVGYRRPVITTDDDKEYPILSIVYPRDQIFTLPFTDGSVKFGSGWIYGGGSHHYAVDYSKDGGKKRFNVKAAAPGRVIYIGWQWNSGNTIVVSHDVNGVKDAYRTVYMHLRNGKTTDCTVSWSRSVKKMRDDGDSRLGDFVEYLEDSGCPETGSKKPEEDFWGTDSETIDTGLLGKKVSRGQFLAYAGNTGPGGKLGGSGANHHLHIKFARKNADDGRWYLIDPYGVYATPGCYPEKVDGKLGSCARYPTVWREGRPKRP